MEAARDVLLRAVRESDLALFFEHQRDPDATSMAAFIPRDAGSFVEHWGRILLDERVTARTVVYDDQVVGYVMQFPQSGIREVAYWIDKTHWGRGIATRALSQFLRLARERPLHAFVAQHNTGSVRVLEKCGFVWLRTGTAAASERGPAVEESTWVLRADEPDGTR